MTHLRHLCHLWINIFSSIVSMRTCTCPHGFPLCACPEGLTGRALLARSRWLSALAGWPGPVDPAEAARVLQEAGGRNSPTLDAPLPAPIWLASAPVRPTVGRDGHDCGCGQGRA